MTDSPCSDRFCCSFERPHLAHQEAKLDGEWHWISDSMVRVRVIMDPEPLAGLMLEYEKNVTE